MRTTKVWWGKALNLKKVKKELSSDNYKAFTVEHVGTSTDITNPINKEGKLAKGTDALYIVDNICGVGYNNRSWFRIYTERLDQSYP